ncbi:MAG TPA: murein biosynthesis integral membrane protein MurJ [Acidimicrobiales bacterium]|nr:murein biosynthesis integral membrane protein MurJ [Acidimicrobiales bacterium]
MKRFGRRSAGSRRSRPLRSFTIGEGYAVDSLARSDSMKSRSTPGERAARSVSAAPGAPASRPESLPGRSISSSTLRAGRELRVKDPYSVAAAVRFTRERRQPGGGAAPEERSHDGGGSDRVPAGASPARRSESGSAGASGAMTEQAEPFSRLTRGRAGLGRATTVMMGGTLLSRVTGLLRLLVAAYALGIGKLSDAFNLANNTPNIVHDLVLGGILAATFVPLFVDRLTRESEGEAERSISAVVSLAAVVLVVATALFVLVAPLVIDLYSVGTHSAHIGQERNVATELLRMFALQLLGYGAISIMTAVLNSVRRFTLPAYVPMLNNLVAIGVLLQFADVAHHPTLASVAHDGGLLLLLGLGTTAGVLLQALLLVPSTLRCGLRLRFRWAPRDDAVREIVRLSGWTLGFVVANQIALFVSLALAVHIDPSGGAVTAYTYAFIFFQLPFGLISVSVMNAVTPELAHRFARGDREGMARQFGLGLQRMMAGIWPATAGYLVLAGPIMKLLLQHGAARAAGVHLTGSMLALLAVGLPGYCTYLLAVRALQSMRDTRSAFFLYLLENGLNVVLLFVLTPRIGPQGLALSLSIAYSVGALVALGVARRKMGGLGGAPVRRFVVRSFGLSILMALCVALVAAGVGSASGLGLLERVVVGVVVGAAVYGGGAALAGMAKGWQTAKRAA